MEVIYNKVTVDEDCPKNFFVEERGYISCCNTMNRELQQTVEEESWSGTTRSHLKAKPHVYKAQTPNGDVDVAAHIEFRGLTSGVSHCPFCGAKVEAVELGDAA